MTNNSKLWLTCFGYAALVVIVVPLSYVIDGFVLSKLWAWLIVPVFGVPELSIFSAIALAVVVGYLFPRSATKSEDDKNKSDIERWGVAVGTFFMRPTVALLIGWILKGML